MNKLKVEKQAAIIGALVEGSSIRSVERMTGVHRDTIMRLLVRVGIACEGLMRSKMKNLPCRRIQVDEIWTYVGKKQAHMRPGDSRMLVGDQWVFVALDPDTKIVPAYRVGKRDFRAAYEFMHDVAGRMANRVQLSSDAMGHYVRVTEAAFGANVDYGQIVKSYEAEPIGPGRYSPPEVIAVDRMPISGNPDFRHISTSHVERQNLTMRMSMRRFTRLTNAFSKKVENLKAAVALHFAHYNFVRVHKTLKVTPAMEAGVVDKLWTLAELVEMAG